MASTAAALPTFQGFRSLCDNSPDAISLMNEQGVILYCSSAHGKLFGCRPERLVGQKFTEFVHPEDRAQPLVALLNVLRNPSTPIQWNGRARGGDGNHFLTENTMRNLLSDVAVQGIVLYQRNITSDGATEDVTLQRALHLARSNARLEQFAHNVAHNLREPLQTISLYLEILGEKVLIDRDGAQVLDVMLNSVSRMAALTDDLLAYSRTSAARVRDLLQQRGVQFEVDCSSALYAIVLGICDYLAALPGDLRIEPHMESAIIGAVRWVILDGLSNHPSSATISTEMIATTVSWAIYGAASDWVRTPNRCPSHEIAQTVVALVCPIFPNRAF